MPAQLPLPFSISMADLTAFLTTYATLEDEIDRLKAELLVCKAQYEDELPMRAVLTALKVTRARQKLANHPKEPLSLPHQAYLEDLVERHLDGRAAQLEQLVADAETLKDAGVTVDTGAAHA